MSLPLDPATIRAAFPGLHQEVHGKPLVYLDSAASAQICQPALDALVHFHTHDRANVHRGVHTLSQRATAAYEAARGQVRRFLNAAEDREIVFTRGTTEAINLVAQTFGRDCVGEGDAIVVTEMEHHSNLVPWQMLCEETGAELRVVPVTDAGELDLDAFEAMLDPTVRLLALVHVSNTLGTVNPVAEMIAMAHAHGILVLLDGAQSAPHLPVDVRALDADFFVFSGHKTVGPTGIGVLYGKGSVLDELSPWQGGGDMIETVSLAGTTFADAPARFEAGTPHIGGAIALGAALDYLSNLGMDRIAAQEAALYEAAEAAVRDLPGLRIVGTAPGKAAVLSFVIDGSHPSDLGTLLDLQGIAVRTGHHCTEPLMQRYGLPGTARASFAFYNTLDEVERFAAGLHKVHQMMGLSGSAA